MESFSARMRKIGVNPYVHVPDDVLQGLFKRAGTSKGPVPVRGRLNGKPFRQTVVKFRGAWRLYLNTQMRKDAGIDVGDDARVQLTFDTRPRIVPMHPRFSSALSRDPKAKTAFGRLAPSHQKEILRYLYSLKTEESLVRNIDKVVRRLRGERPKGMAALMRQPS